MNIKTMAAIVGTLSLGTLATGCATAKPAAATTEAKGGEATCGGDKAATTEAKSGEHKCGAGGCGAQKAATTEEKGGEHKCGAAGCGASKPQ